MADSKLVIDVSKWQGAINWDLVDGTDVYGAVIRCANTLTEDEYFRRNADACAERDIPFGIYLYSTALTIDDSDKEADLAISLASLYKESLPIYIDTEQATTALFAEQSARNFCTRLEDAGYFAGVYASEWWWKTYLSGLGNRYSKWVANWSSKPSIESYAMWQYTSNGTIDGISGRVDCSKLIDTALPNTIMSLGFNNYSAAKTGTVTGRTVYLRSGPGTSYSIVGLVRIGDSLTVTSKTVNGSTTWYQTSSGSWISGVYFEVDQ